LTRQHEGRHPGGGAALLAVRLNFRLSWVPEPSPRHRHRPAILGPRMGPPARHTRYRRTASTVCATSGHGERPPRTARLGTVGGGGNRHGLLLGSGTAIPSSPPHTPGLSAEPQIRIQSLIPSPEQPHKKRLTEGEALRGDRFAAIRSMPFYPSPPFSTTITPP